MIRVRSAIKFAQRLNWERVIVRTVAILVGALMIAYGLWAEGSLVLSIAIFGELLARTTRKLAEYTINVVSKSDTEPAVTRNTKTVEHNSDASSDLNKKATK